MIIEMNNDYCLPRNKISKNNDNSAYLEVSNNC